MLAGCQSARFSPTLPRVSEYGTVHSQPAVAPQLCAKPVDEPVLSAALPVSNPVDGDRQEAHPLPSVANKSWRVQATPLLAAPDTLLTPPPQQPKFPTDPSTTAVNIVGGVTVAAGLGVMITKGFDGRPDAPSLAPESSILVGLGLMVVGVALLCFQGKNGRMRKLREAREAAVAPTAAAMRSQNFKTGLRKTGRVILIVGGALLLLGVAVPYGIYLLGLPAIALILTGLFMVAFSN
ncbi:hypothetical protein J7E24_06050 [Hymenobacter sp. ISL-91]|uniref:hypothetical protein n=1 Tax=Hymenobacter sp. ISL-91 TaxID=2819151 RepID=UPI001BE7A0D4|nr:hypothetical protein [Hymenobacter sp. ISL-91]MBT2557339.1 hypothetical protein [Hymenobacter sp. ISL-91]